MSIQIIKPGMLDTLQDAGRYGYQQLGINPGGAMDRTAMQMVNLLVGNNRNEPVLEMHFPAAALVFETDTMMALSGADFSAVMNDEEVPTGKPVLVKKDSLLQFKKQNKGARVYLAVQGGFVAEEWLESGSTQLQLKTGGFAGRALRKHDRLFLKTEYSYRFRNNDRAFEAFPWQANSSVFYQEGPLRFVIGNEFGLLDAASQQALLSGCFTIGNDSDRMGYRLSGPALQTSVTGEMISTAVTRGTIQLLPTGQLIVLMAEHQTTGGYPRVGYLVSADLPSLAQKRAGESFCLQVIKMSEAEKLVHRQEMNLRQLQNACNFRLQQYQGH